MKTTVIGIDFATEPAKTGLARATVDDKSKAELHEAFTATAVRRKRVDFVARWIQESNDKAPVLIAIDAPLGWPDSMRTEPFTSHVVGQPVGVCADMLFARATDRQIKDRLDKKPLEVGANLIARTAHGALEFLSCLSKELWVPDNQLPLAWSPQDIGRQPCSVIEVYPAATMLAHCIPTDNYKKCNDARKKIIELILKKGLSRKMEYDLAKNDHVVDAMACVLAGLDFLAGRAVGPPDGKTRRLAEKEGWIWAAEKRKSEN